MGGEPGGVGRRVGRLEQRVGHRRLREELHRQVVHDPVHPGLELLRDRDMGVRRDLAHHALLEPLREDRLEHLELARVDIRPPAGRIDVPHAGPVEDEVLERGQETVDVAGRGQCHQIHRLLAQRVILAERDPRVGQVPGPG